MQQGISEDRARPGIEQIGARASGEVQLNAAWSTRIHLRMKPRPTGPPRWVLASLTVGVLLLVLSLWPSSSTREKAAWLRHPENESGRVPHPTEPEQEQALQGFSAFEPPERARVRPLPPSPESTTTEPTPPAEPPPDERPPDEPPLEDTPFAEPPPPPVLPIWAYDYRSRVRPSAPKRVRRVFDPKAPQRGVETALTRHEARIGMDLPGAGQIGTVLATLARSHTSPRSIGVVQVIVASDGHITAVRVVGVRAGSSGAWKRVATLAAAQLAGTVLNVPGRLRHGAVVTVTVHQEIERPSGSGRERAIPKQAPELQPKRKSRREEPVITIKDSLPPDLQGLGDPELMMAPCDSMGAACAGFDGSDLFTHPRRVVHTRIDVRALRPPVQGPRVRKRSRVNKRTPTAKRRPSRRKH